MNLFIFSKKNVKYVKINPIYFYITLSLFLSLFTFISFFFYDLGVNKGKESEILEKDIVVLYNDIENQSFSRRKFYEYLKEVNIKFPEIVFAQALKESGLKSNLFKQNNNPFGMKKAHRRPNLQSGEENGHAYYETWKHAVIDYAMYQSFFGISKIKTEEEYLNYLKENNYYDTSHISNTSYLTDIIKIKNDLDKYLD
jgi:uncharacterized FlgJ-related protein